MHRVSSLAGVNQRHKAGLFSIGFGHKYTQLAKLVPLLGIECVRIC